VADSFALRDFLGVGLEEAPPDHSTISRTRRLIALETHRAVFTWVLQCVGTAGLVKGKTIGIDATTFEANAALRSIVRRDTGETYEAFLTKLAKASGIGTGMRSIDEESRTGIRGVSVIVRLVRMTPGAKSPSLTSSVTSS